MIRLFIALLIPENVKDKLFTILQESGEYSNDYKWESKDKIHLTLKFIGDVKEENLPNIIEETGFVKDYSSFDCTISKFGFFFCDGEAKILWCNLETDDRITSLVSKLNAKLLQFGIVEEKRKFKGHLTLLRVKKKISEKFINRFKDFGFEPIHFNASTIALMQSVLKPTGSEYKVLKNYALK